MGTQIHCKSHLPVHFSMRDLNEDASTGSWSPFHEDKLLKNCEYYNGFILSAHDGYSESDKETLKQTMLQHETIFRKQVYELHRLYRTQRDLMDELRKKELYRYSVPMETSFNPYSSSGDAEKMWKMGTIPIVSSSSGRPSISGADDIKSSLPFIKESKVKSETSPIKSGVHVNGCELLNSKAEKRTFDLQLPAHVYIDSDDGEEIQKGNTPEFPRGTKHYQNNIYGAEPANNVNLTIDVGHKPGQRDDQRRDPYLQNIWKTHYLADLNEPFQGFCAEPEVSTSGNHPGPIDCHEEISVQQLPAKQNLCIMDLSEDFFHYSKKCRDDGVFPNSWHAKNEGYRPEWLANNLQAGQRRMTSSFSPSAFSHEKFPTSSEQLRVDIKRTHELPQLFTSEQGKKETWFRGKASSAELSKRNSVLDSNIMEHVATPKTSLLPVNIRTDDANSASSVLSRRNLKDSITQALLVGVQSLPCLNESFSINRLNMSSNSLCENSVISKEKWDLNSRSHPGSISGVPCQNGFNHVVQLDASVSKFPLVGIDKPNLNCVGSSSYQLSHVPGKILKGLHCTDVKSAKAMDLNICVPKSFQDGAIAIGDLVVLDARDKQDQLKRPAWLRANPTANGLASIDGLLTQKDPKIFKGCSPALSSHVVESKVCNIKIEVESGPCSGFIKDAEAHRSELVDAPTSMIFGFSVQQSSPCTKDLCVHNSSSTSCQNQSQITNSSDGAMATLQCTDTFRKPILFDLEKQPSLEDLIPENGSDNRGSTGSRLEINLNCVAETSDEQPLESVEYSCKTDREVLMSSVPKIHREHVDEIDLEAPVMSSEDITTDSGMPGANQQTEPEKPMPCKVDESENTLARVAAEALLDMSGAQSDFNDAKDRLSSLALGDSLLWLSEVISSKAGDLESVVAASEVRGDSYNELTVDDFDYFEAMTLKLTEMKVEVSCWKSLESETQKEEEIGTSALLTQRRPQRRRGTQRRDFQRDILPGLVSLSRHEVTEDLQTLGGLMKASGCIWKAGIARRSMARNGQARGRRQPRGSASACVSNWMCLMPKQSSNREMEHEGGISLQGWGMTRRCRRQRFPNTNASAALT